MAWLSLVSGVVSHGQGVAGGAPLENFLDHHLDRRKGYVSTKTGFLDDPDLQLAAATTQDPVCLNFAKLNWTRGP